MSYLYHEELHRGRTVLEALAEKHVTVCGAGAVGANVAESLVRAGLGKLRLIDDDRVEERNLSTQPFHRADVGAPKARLVANALYRAVGAEVEAVTKRLEASNAKKLLRGTDLVIDGFDNSASRRAVAEQCAADGTPCLHVALASAYAEVLWNEGYRIPSEAQDDVCDYPLARNLVTLATSVACEAVFAFLAGGERRAFTVTLGDLAVRPYEAPPES